MRFTVALFLLHGSLLVAGSPPPVLTVCEVMADLDRYDGKVVVVVGRLDGTDEGAWLAQNCGLKVTRAGREFEPSLSLVYFVGAFEPPPPLPTGFKWDRILIGRKLAEVKKTTEIHRKYKERWFACFGRLETHLPYLANINGKTFALDGFGHLGGSPAQLVEPDSGYLRLK